MPTAIDLQNRRTELIADRVRLIRRAREIFELAESEGRPMTAEERTNYDSAFDASADIQTRIQDLDSQVDMDRFVRDARTSLGVSGATDDLGNESEAETGSGNSDASERDLRGIELTGQYEQRANAITQFLTQEVGPIETEARDALERYVRGGRSFSRSEARALQMDDDESGGALVPPQEFIARLIQAVDDRVYMRQWGTVETLLGSQSLGVASLDADPADPIWTSEIGTGDEDSTMDFGKREFRPRPLAKRIKISRRLLRHTAGRAEGIVRERLAYKFATTMENTFLNGGGAETPLGVFTASADGISTGRDSLTGSATNFTFDGLILAKYTLKPQYWERARWLFHRDGVRRIAQLTDDQSNYLWRESVRAGEPDRLLGRPAFMSEFAPNTFTAGLYVGMLADWSNYWIVDSLAITIQRLDELYAETNQVGFIGRMESDGMPVLEEAFVRLRTD